MKINYLNKNTIPNFINKKRSKFTSKLNLKFKNDLIQFIDSFTTYDNFKLERILNNSDKDIIKVNLIYYNYYTDFNYFDLNVENLCTFIANELRDLIGHNIWFDLKNGIFYFFVAEN